VYNALSDSLGCENTGERVKKLAIGVLLVVLGCQRQVKVTSAPATTTPTSASGAASAREAVQKFMATAKDQNIQAMAEIWGTRQGPASATMEQERLEKSLIFMMRCLRHDSYSIVSETQVAGGDRQFTVQLRRGTLTATSPFKATPGPNSRWYLQSFEPEPLNVICTSQ
jgi:hypothetical protein